jgi:hypothetical protein
MFYVRWKAGEDRRGRIFPTAGAVGGLPCPVCTRRLDADLPIQLIAIGPDPDSEESQRKYREDRWHTAMAAALHAGCAAALSDDVLERFVDELEVVGPDG